MTRETLKPQLFLFFEPVRIKVGFTEQLSRESTGAILVEKMNAWLDGYAPTCSKCRHQTIDIEQNVENMEWMVRGRCKSSSCMDAAKHGFQSALFDDVKTASGITQMIDSAAHNNRKMEALAKEVKEAEAAKLKDVPLGSDFIGKFFKPYIKS